MTMTENSKDKKLWNIWLLKTTFWNKHYIHSIYWSCVKNNYCYSIAYIYGIFYVKHFQRAKAPHSSKIHNPIRAWTGLLFRINRHLQTQQVVFNLMVAKKISMRKTLTVCTLFSAMCFSSWRRSKADWRAIVFRLLNSVFFKHII